MKRFFRSVVCVIATVTALALPVFAGGNGFEEVVYPTIAPVSANATLAIDAAGAILVERDTGRVLYEKNPDAPRAIASITKVMTMLLVVEAVDEGKITLEDVVVASEHAYSMGGSQIWLEPGETMTVDELMRAVAVASANDAAVALAEHVSGSEDEFVASMNRRAAELGMTATVFKNSNGLDEPGHISSARDVSFMSRELLKHELAREYITIWTDELRAGETQLANTNKLLKLFSGTTGIKTGTTDDAGICVSASAVRDGMELVAVVLGSSSSASRFDAAKTMLSYGFSNYELAEIGELIVPPIKVRLGEYDMCEVTYEAPTSFVVRKGMAQFVHSEVKCEQTIDAPVAMGTQVGEISVYCEQELLFSCPVTAAADVPKITLGSGLLMLLRALVRL